MCHNSPAPPPGGKEVVTATGVTWKYCAKCRRWNKATAKSAHVTSEHKVRDCSGNHPPTATTQIASEYEKKSSGHLSISTSNL